MPSPVNPLKRVYRKKAPIHDRASDAKALNVAGKGENEPCQHKHRSFQQFSTDADLFDSVDILSQSPHVLPCPCLGLQKPADDKKCKEIKYG